MRKSHQGCLPYLVGETSIELFIDLNSTCLKHPLPLLRPHLPSSPSIHASLRLPKYIYHGATSLIGALPPRAAFQRAFWLPSVNSADSRDTRDYLWQRANLLANCLGYAASSLNRPPPPSERVLKTPIAARAGQEEAYICTECGTLVDQDSHPGEGDQHANRYSRTVSGCRFSHRLVASCCTCCGEN
jgi:hypothetical protein